MCAVVGDNRSLGLCISFLNGFDLVFGHIHCAEYEINTCCYFFHFVDIHDNDLFHCLRHRSVHFPAASYGFFVCLACGTCTCCNRYHLKPRMILQKGDKSLAYHTSSTKDTYFQLFTHFLILLLSYARPVCPRMTHICHFYEIVQDFFQKSNPFLKIYAIMPPDTLYNLQ